MCPQTRKPYTITKQREKWTDQEHARFLDALRMYGRAWRRIEGARHALLQFLATSGPLPLLPILTSYPDAAEHIGSKTAVQIRSHAQKFFSKLEKQEMSGAKGEGAFAWESISSTSIWAFMCPPMVRSEGPCCSVGSKLAQPDGLSQCGGASWTTEPGRLLCICRADLTGELGGGYPASVSSWHLGRGGTEWHPPWVSRSHAVCAQGCRTASSTFRRPAPSASPRTPTPASHSPGSAATMEREPRRARGRRIRCRRRRGCRTTHIWRPSSRATSAWTSPLRPSPRPPRPPRPRPLPRSFLRPGSTSGRTCRWVFCTALG